MDLKKLEDLLYRYNSGECTTEEKEWVEQWYLSFDWNRPPGEISGNEIRRLGNEVFAKIREKRDNLPFTQVDAGTAVKTRSIGKWLKYSVAASVLLIGGAIAYYSLNKKDAIAIKDVPAQVAVSDIKPGTNKAKLTLADGSVVVLDSLGASQLKEKDGTLISNQQGRLIYDGTRSNESAIVYNSLDIPRGGEYEIILPDGSKVWVNAASTLRFPTRFFAGERKVFLDGEAYFEVAKNAGMPFKVIVNNELEVEVLGTNFNIMAYGDEEETKTTLVTGKVKVSKEKNTVVLNPSKQAVWTKANKKLAVSDADVEKAIAWKNGMIEFHEDNFPYIMRQISRWYDVEVVYEGKYPAGNYSGSIHRQAPLSQVLEILQAAGVKFRMSDKKLVVLEP